MDKKKKVLELRFKSGGMMKVFVMARHFGKVEGRGDLWFGGVEIDDKATWYNSFADGWKATLELMESKIKVDVKGSNLTIEVEAEEFDDE